MSWTEDDDDDARRHQEARTAYMKEQDWHDEVERKYHKLKSCVLEIASTFKLGHYNQPSPEERQKRWRQILKHVKDTEHIELFAYDYTDSIIKALEEIKPMAEKALQDREKREALK
jgi:hypothetical protein